MERIGLTELASALGTRPERTGSAAPDAAGGTAVSGVATDSRTVRSGDLFFALPGERFDGHRFVADAIRATAW